MSRYFAIQTWVGSHENEPDYSGQQCGSRSVRSSEVVPLYDIYGNANVLAFSDEAIAARNNANKKPTGIPIRDRILPQFKRLQTLRTQMVDLEKEYKTTDMTCAEYSMLRDVIVCKIARAEVLYRKAISVRPTPHEDDEYADEMPEVEAVSYANFYEVGYTDTGTWVDDLPNSNSLKIPMKKALQVAKTLVRWHQKARNYINELKAV
jgi:hypothetical protein